MLYKDEKIQYEWPFFSLCILVNFIGVFYSIECFDDKIHVPNNAYLLIGIKHFVLSKKRC